MLYTASFYSPEDWIGQAYRVSRQHPRGRRTQWETLPFLYPAREILSAYRGGGIDFPTLAAEYRRGLDEGYQGLPEFREWVASIPSLDDFTLLCFERAGQPCHRLELARWLLERVPSLMLGNLR